MVQEQFQTVLIWRRGDLKVMRAWQPFGVMWVTLILLLSFLSPRAGQVGEISENGAFDEVGRPRLTLRPAFSKAVVSFEGRICWPKKFEARASVVF